MSDKTTDHAKRRSVAATAFFAATGLAALGSVVDWNRSWPLVLFYAVITLNTYFSVRCFASITPENNFGQKSIDAALVVCMLFLVLNFNSIVNFAAVASLLFMIATLKYIFLVPLSGYSKLLYMKIRIDALGTLYCFLTVLAALWGYGRIASVIWSLGFALANVHVLWREPHYDLGNHYENSQ